MKQIESISTRSHIIGIYLTIFAFLCAAIMNALGKVGLQTIPLGMLLFAQNLFALCFCIPLIIRSPSVFRTKHLKSHFFRASTGLLSYACLFIAVQYISLVNATLLANSAPLFLPFVVRIWFGQKIRKSLWISLIIGFLGVFFILNHGDNISTLFNSWMILVALLGSLFSAIALQFVRNLSSTESSSTIIIYYFLISTILTMPLFISQFHMLGQTEWFILVAIGFLLACIQFSLAQAYHHASPTLLGPFNYTVVIFSGLIQWIYWDVIPGFVSLIGITLISLGGILSITQQKKINFKEKK